MNNNVYPFFIECSKYYQDQPYKQRLLQQFAFGRGGSFIIKRKDKNILVTPDGEFVIPSLYSENVPHNIGTYGPQPQVPGLSPTEHTLWAREAEPPSSAGSGSPSGRRGPPAPAPKGLPYPLDETPDPGASLGRAQGRCFTLRAGPEGPNKANYSIYDPAIYTLWAGPGGPTTLRVSTAAFGGFKFDDLTKKKIEDFHTARLELDQKLWKYDDYAKMQENIKNLRTLWSTTKKKDKLYLFYKYISNLELSTNEKIILCNLITLTLLLKLVRPSDILYKDFIIQNVNQDLLTNKSIDAIEFSYDYSIPTKIKKINSIEIEDDDEY